MQVTIDIDPTEVLSDLHTADLVAELACRRRQRGHSQVGEPDPWLPADVATALRSAFYARNASRFEALLILLDSDRISRPSSEPVAMLPITR